MNTAELNSKLTSFLNTTADVINWTDTYAKPAGAINPAVLKQNLFDISKSVNKYINALRLRPTVGLFGASQVGKSFLVSVLGATEGNTSVKILDPSAPHCQRDFLMEINPL